MVQLGKRKSEAVLITNRRKKNAISIHVGGLIITLESVIRYLKVVIDAKINFKYPDYACEIPANTSVTLVQMISGDMAVVIHFTLLNAAAVLEEAPACESNRRKVKD